MIVQNTIHIKKVFGDSNMQAAYIMFPPHPDLCTGVVGDLRCGLVLQEWMTVANHHEQRLENIHCGGRSHQLLNRKTYHVTNY